MGGLTGAILTGLFATTSINPGGADGLLYGNPNQFFIQVISVIITGVYAFGMTFIFAKILDSTVGLHVSENEEIVGLDISEHGERAYA